jgi:hypothetical protein
MKSVKIFLLTILVSGALQSCSESWLDLKEPINPTLETYYTDTVTAYNGLVGCYNSLQMVPVAEQPIGVLFDLDIRSDDSDYCGNPKGASEEGNYYHAAGFANFDIYSDTEYALSIWKYGFRGVNTINKYLEGVATIKLTPLQQNLIDQYKAEAKFIRAYFYFTLVKNFGPVPLITKTLDQADWFNQKRIPENEVYAQIFKDLREAIPLLPLKSKYLAAQANRITKGAAQALLAKTLITEAKLNSSSPNWAEAFQLCKEIENSSEYNLNTNFKDIWNIAGQFSSEVVFDIVFEETISSENDSYLHYLSPRFIFINNKPDHSRKMEFGFGLCGITEDLANQFGYNQDGDINSYQNMNDIRGRYTFWARYDKYCGFSVVDRLTQRPETKNVENVDDANYYSRKYNREALAKNYSTAGSNFHFIRYAEVLLLGAEAAYYQGNESEALRLVNLVRERAFREAIAAGRVTLPGIKRTSSGAAVLADIWQERRLELAGEADRFYDLKRTDRLESVLRKQKPGILFQAGKHELLPIPSSELSKSPFLTQNNGY